MTPQEAGPPWPLGFSTLGCPTDPPNAIASTARRHGIHHVELRAHSDGPVHVRMPHEVRRNLLDAMTAADIVVVNLASYIELADAGVATRAVVDDALRHIELAEQLGASAVRVFGGGPRDDSTVAHSRERLDAVLAATAGSDVAILLETHDRLPRGQDVADVLADMPARAAAVWDVVNPWRTGETPEATARALDGRIALVQVKDALSPENVAPVLPGTGAVPLAPVLEALASRGWYGVLSLEWERAWYPEVAPLDAAIPAARSWLASAWQTTETRKQVDPCSS
jgi:sugar phosphate isomerase/epimerase